MPNFTTKDIRGETYASYGLTGPAKDGASAGRGGLGFNSSNQPALVSDAGVAIVQVGTSSVTIAGTIDQTVASVATTIGLALDDNTALTTGQLVKIASSATAIATTGRLLSVVHSGATSTSGILTEFSSAANDETTVVKITASDLLAAGVALDISCAAMTTGKCIDISDLAAITTGKAIHVDATGVTHTTGILVHLDSASTAITGAGRILLSDHTGNAGDTNAILNEFASAAADECVIVKITASAALALGVALQVSGAAITTGTGISMANLDALTTGSGLVITSNSSSTGTRNLVKITNDNTAATGTTCLTIQNDATAGSHIALTGTGVNGIDFTALTAADTIFNCTAGTGCTAAPQTNAAVGFINILVAGTPQWIPYYNAT